MIYSQSKIESALDHDKTKGKGGGGGGGLMDVVDENSIRHAAEYGISTLGLNKISFSTRMALQ